MYYYRCLPRVEPKGQGLYTPRNSLSTFKGGGPRLRWPKEKGFCPRILRQISKSGFEICLCVLGVLFMHAA